MELAFQEASNTRLFGEKQHHIDIFFIFRFPKSDFSRRTQVFFQRDDLKQRKDSNVYKDIILFVLLSNYIHQKIDNSSDDDVDDKQNTDTKQKEF